MRWSSLNLCPNRGCVSAPRRPVHRILRRSARFFEKSRCAEGSFQQRIVIDDPHRAWGLCQRPLEPLQNFGQCALRQRVEKEEHEWIGWKSEIARGGEHGLDLHAALRRAPIVANVLLRRAMQFRNQLHSYNPLQWILRSHQQRSSLAGTEIDKGEFIELDGEPPHYLLKQTPAGRLIRG